MQGDTAREGQNWSRTREKKIEEHSEWSDLPRYMYHPAYRSSCAQPNGPNLACLIPGQRHCLWSATSKQASKTDHSRAAGCWTSNTGLCRHSASPSAGTSSPLARLVPCSLRNVEKGPATCPFGPSEQSAWRFGDLTVLCCTSPPSPPSPPPYFLLILPLTFPAPGRPRGEAGDGRISSHESTSAAKERLSSLASQRVALKSVAAW
jgi:hypothetical protein